MTGDRAVVFDLDGTLVDSARGIAAAVNRALSDLNHAPLTDAKVTSFIGNGVPVLIERVRGACGINPVLQDTLLASFRRHYEADPLALTALFPGVSEALSDLSDRGYRLAVCTNKPERPTHLMLEGLGLDGVFETVVGGDTTPLRKPDPAPLQLVLDRLGCGGVFVGDSEVDAETADRAGVPFYLFTRGYRKTPVEKLPHRASFSDFTALPSLVTES